MTFKFYTFDPTQDPDDFNRAFSPTPSSSPSTTLCQPCGYTYTFTKTVVGRLVAAGASFVLKAPAPEFHDREVQDRSAETPFHSINFDVRPEFHRRQLKEFTLKELQVATQNFSEKKIIGRGGFGDVYEGQFADGSLVAIKRYKSDGGQGLEEFESEVKVGKIIPPRHNLLPMLGFCRPSKCWELLLVFPLMINKSVDSCLREQPETQPPLDWLTRRKIALGAARGLSHLHDLNIVHRDIKPGNIMLDEEFEPHIGDFGLTRFINSKHDGHFVDYIAKAPVPPGNECEAGSDCGCYCITTLACGTVGYLAPEYIPTSRCTVKTDVYAFGVVLLQLVTGQRAVFFTDGDYQRLLTWVRARSWEDIVDPNLRGVYDEEEMKKVIQLALLCTQEVPRERPYMAQVVQILEGHSIEERFKRYYLEYQHYSWTDRRLERNVDVYSSLLDSLFVDLEN